MLRVALKYCGGCNPDYDRLAVAETIRGRLDGRVEFVPAGSSEGVDIVLVLAGCESACTDLSAFAQCEAVFIRSAKDAHRKITALLRRKS